MGEGKSEISHVIAAGRGQNEEDCCLSWKGEFALRADSSFLAVSILAYRMMHFNLASSPYAAPPSHSSVPLSGHGDGVGGQWKSES